MNCEQIIPSKQSAINGIYYWVIVPKWLQWPTPLSIPSATPVQVLMALCPRDGQSLLTGLYVVVSSRLSI